MLLAAQNLQLRITIVEISLFKDYTKTGRFQFAKVRFCGVELLRGRINNVI
jgi:hypothetical protein